MSTGTLALASGTFTSPWNTPGAETKLVATTNKGVETITSPLKTTLNNVLFTGNSAASNFVLSAGTNLVTTNSSYDFAAGNDILVISSTLKNSSSGTVASNSFFNLGSGADRLTLNGGVSNISVDAGAGADTIEAKGNTSNSTFLLGSENDKITFSGNVANSSVDAGSGADTMTFGGSVSGSTVIGGAGKDAITFSKAVSSSSVSSGEDSDTIRFNNSVGSTQISAGAGSDLLVFGGTITGTRGTNTGTQVDLGGQDGAIDTIQIARGVSYGGLKITGASAGDILFIGSTKYTYNPLQDKWINPSTSPLAF